MHLCSRQAEAELTRQLVAAETEIDYLGSQIALKVNNFVRIVYISFVYHFLTILP